MLFVKVNITFKFWKNYINYYPIFGYEKKNILKKGDVKISDEFILATPANWYGPEKIYTDDEKDNK